MNKNASQNSAAIHFCSVCDKHLFQEPFADCPICNWKNDIVQEEHPDWGGCANVMSLNNTRKPIKSGKRSNKSHICKQTQVSKEFLRDFNPGIVWKWELFFLCYFFTGIAIHGHGKNNLSLCPAFCDGRRTWRRLFSRPSSAKKWFSIPETRRRARILSTGIMLQIFFARYFVPISQSQYTASMMMPICTTVDNMAVW